MPRPYREEPQPLERLYQSLYEEGSLSLPPTGLDEGQMIDGISDLLARTKSGSALHFITYCSVADDALQPVSQVYERCISPRPLNYNDLTDDDKLSALKSFVAEKGLELCTEERCKIQLRTDG